MTASAGEFIEPRWVRVVALGCVLAFAAIGGTSLLFADLGIYQPAVVIVLALVAFLALGRAARPLLQSGGPAGTTAHVTAALAVATAVASAIWNGANAAEHVQMNRDGAVYLNAGRWIAKHGTLDVRPYVGAFRPGPQIVTTSTGMKLQGTHLEFSLSHMLSAVLAVAQSIGGDRMMFLTEPILGGVALLAFYLLACRLLRHPVAALGATATLALLMPQVWFSRDTMTEIPIQLMLFTTLWLLCDRRTLPMPGPAFCAGLLLGLVQATHIDGIAFLVGLPAVYALWWLHADGKGRERLRRGIVSSAAGVGVGMALAGLDLIRWDRSYVHQIGGNLLRLAAVVVLALAAGIAAVFVVRRTNVFERVQRVRGAAANVACALVAIGGFGAWFLRPHLQTVRADKKNPQTAFLQAINHLPVDAGRRYAELSVRWISWYVGPVTLTVAVVAAAALARLLVRGSARMPVRIASLMLTPPALVYVWRPSITPDHIWAMRRFLPAVFPAIVLLAFGAVSFLWTQVSASRTPASRTSVRVIAAALGVVTIAFPIHVLGGLAQMTQQRGQYAAIEAACKVLGPHGAVVMVPEPRSVEYLSDPQTLRTFCNVPVAVMVAPVRARALRELATQWKADGRQLFVVADFPATIAHLFPTAQVSRLQLVFNPHALEPTLTRRPSHYLPERLGRPFGEILHLVAAPVPVSQEPGTDSGS